MTITVASRTRPDRKHVITNEGTSEAYCSCEAAMFGKACWAVSYASDLMERERSQHERAKAALRKDKPVEPVFESVTAFTPEVIGKLNAALDPARVAVLVPFEGGPQIPYLPGHDVIRTANEIFGYGNWGFNLLSPPWAERGEDGKGKPFTVWMAMGRLDIRGGRAFTDMGSNQQSGLGAPATEMSAKGAVTDALKRCLMHYGDQFGLVLYDKEMSRADLAQQFEDAGGEALPKATNAPIRARLNPPIKPGTWAELTARMPKEKAFKRDVEGVIGEFSAEGYSKWLGEHPGRGLDVLFEQIRRNKGGVVMCSLCTADSTRTIDNEPYCDEHLPNPIYAAAMRD